MLRRIFKWLALALFAYVAAALLAKPNLLEVLHGTFIPSFKLDEEFLSIVVACSGTSLSAYIFTWQSNQEVEEDIAEGKRRWWQRRGATFREMQIARRDVLSGMIFSNVILYLIILSTGATFHPVGQLEIDSAAQAARP